MRNPDLKRSGADLRLGSYPWQQLPEMAHDRAAERAGVIAGLRVVELFHMHAALRLKPVNRQAATLRLRAAAEAVTLRCNLARAMQ